MTTTVNDVTPAEADLPLIISVDDHILEPRELWQRELPASLRERGPRVIRERARLDFRGGRLTLERDVPDGEWCDLWCFEDLVVPTGLLHAPVGRSAAEQSNRPAIYEDFRAGAYDQAARLAGPNPQRTADLLGGLPPLPQQTYGFETLIGLHGNRF